MKILAYNTAFSQTDIAFDNGKKVAYSKIDSSCKVSENVMVEIDKILEATLIKDLDVVGVVIGPGSFTGIRIGVALAKGFMVANRRLKAVSVSSLELMAYCFAKTKANVKFTCVLNALSGNYFVQRFDKTGKPVDEAKMLFGDDLDEVEKEFVVGYEEDKLEFANADIIFSPEMLLELIKQKANDNIFTNESMLLPVYLRLSQAEQNLKDKEKNENKKSNS